MTSQGTAIAETPLLAFDDIQITSARAILNGTTYAVANLTSVRMNVQQKPHILMIGAIFFTVVGLLLGWYIAGPVVGAILAIWWYLTPERYWVLLATAGSEHRAWCSTKNAAATAVLAALNQAIVSRG